jgi:hypothetical protein
MIIEQTIVIPTDRRLKLNLPESFPCGKARLSITTDTARDDSAEWRAERRPDFDTRFAGAVSPALSGKGKINGDIIGPFYEEWEANT